MITAIESGEMIEAQRISIDSKPFGLIAKLLACGQIPGRDIQTSAAQNAHTLEERRNQINPALVREQAILNISSAKIVCPT